MNTGSTAKIPAVKFKTFALNPIDFGDVFNKIYADANIKKNA